MARDRRAQVLMEPEHYKQLEKIARLKKTSVGSIIREAVEEKYFAGNPARIVAEICSMNLPTGEWEDFESDLVEARDAGIS